jgi:hypothetical protein
MVKLVTSVLLPTASNTLQNEAIRNDLWNKLQAAVERQRAQRATGQQRMQKDALTLPESVNSLCPQQHKPGMEALSASIAEQVICFESEDAICAPALSK